MDLFGVEELPNSRVITQPGYAFGPDLGPYGGQKAGPGRKRAARKENQPSSRDQTAAQDRKILSELAALDKESHKDVFISVPIRARDGAGRASHGKVTPTVRKILQSQKTFANHLSDFEALLQSNPHASPFPLAPTQATRLAPADPSVPVKRSHKKKDPNAATTPLRKVSVSGALAMPETGKDEIPPLSSAQPEVKAHPGDEDALLKSRIPEMSTQEEIEKLLRMPPLTYLEARAQLDTTSGAPSRKFCSECGYWGRVKCRMCGSRVCALECLKEHQVECYTRYGA